MESGEMKILEMEETHMAETNYRQDETSKVLGKLRTAARRTANPQIANTIESGCERIAQMESLIFRLLDAQADLIKDNEKLNQTIDRLESERGKKPDGYDYEGVIKAFYKTGKESMHIPLERRGTKNPWYTPNGKGFRAAARRLGLPIEVFQRTSGKDVTVEPRVLLLRSDLSMTMQTSKEEDEA